MKQAARDRTVVHRETRNEKFDLRLTPSAKRTLQTAALAAHQSVSEFVLESALARAEEHSRRLARLLKEPSVFERGSVE
jgi:uncharacterized protein (DUF1778 family)